MFAREIKIVRRGVNDEGSAVYRLIWFEYTKVRAIKPLFADWLFYRMCLFTKIESVGRLLLKKTTIQGLRCKRA